MWYAKWEQELEGDYTCTLYVNVLVQEHRIKPKKGHTFNWSSLPGEISHNMQPHSYEAAEVIREDSIQWNRLIHNIEPSLVPPTPEETTTHHNRFTVLSEEASRIR